LPKREVNRLSEAVPAKPENAARVWGVAGWTGWGIRVACGTVISLLAAFLVTWKASPSCGGVATSSNVRTGMTGLGIAALILAALWVSAVLLAPRRWRPMVIGLIITLLPLGVMAATHAHAGDWNHGGFWF
jgi:hypothetical protein